MSKVHVAITRSNTSNALRAFAETETSALFKTELARRQDEWRGALTSIKDRLADLEATCDAVMSATPDPPVAAVSELIEKIVAAAAANADAVAQQVEARAHAESAETQALLARLQTEVRSAHEQLRIAREQADAEQGARARAESASQYAQAAHKEAIAALETQVRAQEAELQSHRAEVAGLQQRVAAGQVERATLDALQRAVQGAVAALKPVQSAPPSPSPSRRAAVQKSTPDAAKEAPASPAPWPPAADADAVSPTPGEPPDRRLDGVELRAPDTYTDPSQYVAALLEKVETMYWEDVKLVLSPAEVVDRLTANLRHASDLYAARVSSSPAGDKSLFIDHVTRLTDVKAATSFGRHLSIAAYATERHERRSGSAAPQVVQQA